MIRGTVTSVIEGVIKLFSATGRQDAVGGSETFEQREYLQHYGFTSRPKPDAEMVIIREGNHIVAIASDDRRYRIAVENGEVALYTDEGDKIHLKRGRLIEIVAGAQVHVAAPLVTVTASTKVTLDTPLVETTGEIRALGDITDHYGSTGRSMSGMRQIYDEHTHPDPDGNTGVPNQQM